MRDHIKMPLFHFSFICSAYQLGSLFLIKFIDRQDIVKELLMVSLKKGQRLNVPTFMQASVYALRPSLCAHLITMAVDTTVLRNESNTTAFI